MINLINLSKYIRREKICCQNMSFNYYESYNIVEKPKKKPNKNESEAALCNTHHNSTIETNIRTITLRQTKE